MGIKDIFKKATSYVKETAALNKAYYETESQKAAESQPGTYQIDGADGFNQDEYDRMRDDIQKHYEQNFDLNTLEGISSIPAKKYVFSDWLHGDITYVLQRKATEHKRNKRMDLAIAGLGRRGKGKGHCHRVAYTRYR